jgi:hypothetical protein
MESINEHKLSGALSVIYSYNERIREILDNAHNLLKLKNNHSEVLNDVRNVLIDIRKEVLAINYIQESYALKEILSICLIELSDLIKNKEGESKIVNSLKQIKKIIEKDGSIKLKILDETINACLEKVDSIKNGQFDLLLSKVMSFIQFAVIKIPIFDNIPFEPKFGDFDPKASPRLLLLGFLNYIDVSIVECEAIISANLKIRSFKLPNGVKRLQVKIKKNNSIFKFLSKYRDLEIENLLNITISIISDLYKVKELCNNEKISVAEALKKIRHQKSIHIERNVQLFNGWSPDTNSFKSLLSRYKNLFIIGSVLILAMALVVLTFHATLILFLFQVADTFISIVLFAVLFYIVYLIISGLIHKSGRFEITKRDITLNVPKESLNEISIHYGEINDTNLYKYLNELKIKISLFYSFLPEIKKRIIENKLDINFDEKCTLINKLYDVITKDNKSVKEKELIKEIFPFQLIIIPAVNDKNVIELVNNKVLNCDYPNVLFVVAIEERDLFSQQLIYKAINDGTLAKGIKHYVGTIELSNLPNQLRKPLNKPKNLNKTLSSILSQLEGISEEDLIKKGYYPEYLMIWDLEDDPGTNQLWSMVIANSMINFTIDRCIELFYKHLKEFNFEKFTLSKLRKIDFATYENVKRFGLDLKILNKLKLIYSNHKESLIKENNFSTENLISAIEVKADLDLFIRIKREIEYYGKMATAEGNYKERNSRFLEVQQNLLKELNNKYCDSELFVAEEFKRRMIPADVQGILISRMYGESSMSPLEWEFWFDLVLPGLMAFKYDILIFPITIFAAITGGYYFGLLGVLIGLTMSLILSFGLGQILLLLGIDLRNKTGLSFSAGTTNNFNFKTLVYNISGYPEYNIAEDWSIAIELAKLKNRSLLINGYGTPTYEDSLAPLGPPFWAQHSRWIGGHFQSFPQVFVSVKKVFKEFGILNWIHSFFMIVLFSLTPVLVGFVLIKSILYVIIELSIKAEYLFLKTSMFFFPNKIKSFINEINWWIPEDSNSGIILLIVSPVLIILLGLIPIFRRRPDDKIMVDKSIEDLKIKKEELLNNKNEDINLIIKELYKIPKFFEKDLINTTNFYKNKKVFTKGFISTKKSVENNKIIDNRIIERLYEFINKKEGNLKTFIKIIQMTEGKFNEFILKDINKIEKKIENIEKGKILGLNIGKYNYSILIRIIMNFGMVYYYLHSIPSTLLYFKQIWFEMDNQWRQTKHRDYGSIYYKAVSKILINELRSYNA